MMKKVWIVVLVCVLAMTLLLSVIVISSWIHPSNLKKAEKVFEEDKELLTVIAAYLSKWEESDLRLELHTGVLKSYEDIGEKQLDIKTLPIHDVSVKEAIQALYDKGYQAFYKDENTIHALRWSRMDFGSGFAFSINHTTKPELQFCTKLEPLSEEGWYYYEEDYNEWQSLKAVTHTEASALSQARSQSLFASTP